MLIRIHLICSGPSVPMSPSKLDYGRANAGLQADIYLREQRLG
jgi:hypothetical protein